MTIGVLGGTFNPIHIGHLWLAQEVGSELKFSKVLFVPSRIPPHKKSAISEIHRLAMVKLAIRDNPCFEVSTVEIDRPEISYTIHTLEILKREYREPLAFIIGSDNVKGLPTWYQWKDILKMCDLVIGERPGIGVETIDELEPFLEKLQCDRLRRNFVSMPTLDISASKIRQRYTHQKSNKYLVPDAVNEYILGHKLYR